MFDFVATAMSQRWQIDTSLLESYPARLDAVKKAGVAIPNIEYDIELFAVLAISLNTASGIGVHAENTKYEKRCTVLSPEAGGLYLSSASVYTHTEVSSRRHVLCYTGNTLNVMCVVYSCDGGVFMD